MTKPTKPENKVARAAPAAPAKKAEKASETEIQRALNAMGGCITTQKERDTIDELLLINAVEQLCNKLSQARIDVDQSTRIDTRFDNVAKNVWTLRKDPKHKGHYIWSRTKNAV